MSMKRSAGLVGATLLAATMATALPQGAKAESGFLWLDPPMRFPPARPIMRHARAGEPAKGGGRSERALCFAAAGSRHCPHCSGDTRAR